MAQYEAEFTALSRYALELVSTKARKAAKFQRALRADIRHAFGGAMSVDYATVIQRAYAIERDRNEWRGRRQRRKEPIRIRSHPATRKGRGQEIKESRQRITHHVINVGRSMEDRA